MKEKLNEEKAVNEVQLKDIFDMASKVESQIISLASLAINFSDSSVKQSALVLRSKAHEFTTLLGNLMMGEEVDVVDSGKKQLDAKPEGEIIESFNFDKKEEDEKEFETIDESISEDFAQPNNEEGTADDFQESFDLSGTFAEHVNETTDVRALAESVATELSLKCSTRIEKIGTIGISKFVKAIQTLKESVDTKSFDSAMGKIYDLADAHKIQIKIV